MFDGGVCASMKLTYFKFILIDDGELIIGENTHHIHLLNDRFGVDYFPDNVVAIGTGTIGDDSITGVGFDFGTLEDRERAMEAIRSWALDQGYNIAPHVTDLYYKLAGKNKGWDSPIAFIWDGSRILIGDNHPTIISTEFHGGGSNLWFDFEPIEKAVYGWLRPNEDGHVRAEIITNFYSNDYKPKKLQPMLKELRDRWNVTEIIYGEDEKKIKDADKILADPRYAAVDKFAGR